MGFDTDVKFPHIGRHEDLTTMTLHDFLRGLILQFEKIMIESHLYPGWMTGSPTGTFYPKFIVEDKQITLDTSKMTVTEKGFFFSFSFNNVFIYSHTQKKHLQYSK